MRRELVGWIIVLSEFVGRWIVMLAMSAMGDAGRASLGVFHVNVGECGFCVGGSCSPNEKIRHKVLGKLAYCGGYTQRPATGKGMSFAGLWLSGGRMRMI